MTRAVQSDRAEVLRGGSWVWLPFADCTAAELSGAFTLLLELFSSNRGFNTESAGSRATN